MNTVQSQRKQGSKARPRFSLYFSCWCVFFQLFFFRKRFHLIFFLFASFRYPHFGVERFYFLDLLMRLVMLRSVETCGDPTDCRRSSEGPMSSSSLLSSASAVPCNKRTFVVSLSLSLLFISPCSGSESLLLLLPFPPPPFDNGMSLSTTCSCPSSCCSSCGAEGGGPFF